MLIWSRTMFAWRSCFRYIALCLPGCFLGVPPLAEQGGTGGDGGSAGASACVPGTFIECYEGPEGTVDNGVCKQGTALCLPAGDTDVCENQSLPSIERCHTEPEPEDEDCNGSTNEHCAAWAAQYGLWSRQSILGLSLTTEGDLLIAGPNTGAIDFGEGNLTPTGGTRSFVARIDPSERRCPGTHCWSALLAGTGSTKASGIAESTQGDVLLVGGFTSQLNLGTATENSMSTPWAMFVARRAKDDGAVAWISWYGAGGDQELLDVAALPAGGSASVGFMENTVNFGGMAGSVSADAAEDAVVVALDSAGIATWAHAYGGPGD